jgi:exodeoxyribonuclease-1
MLTSANGLVHEAAHDALSDVYATIALAKLIKTKQPKLYDYAYRLRDKRFAASLIDMVNLKPLLHISSRFPSENGNAALVLPLMLHPSNKNSVVTFNLLFSPADLFALSVEQMRERLFTRTEDLPAGVERLALKEVHLNKTPMLLPLNMLDDEAAHRLQINKSLCEAHWREFNGLSTLQWQELRQRLYALYSSMSFGERQDPDQMLYSGFFEAHDKKQMQLVRRLSPEQLAVQVIEFDDERLPELFFRYRARNFPESLTAEETQRWRVFCGERLSDLAAGASVTLPMLYERIEQMRAAGNLSQEQHRLLDQLAVYAEDCAAKAVMG